MPEIAALLKAELNLPPETSTAAAVERACTDLEVKMEGLSLVAKAQACWRVIVSPEDQREQPPTGANTTTQTVANVPVNLSVGGLPPSDRAGGAAPSSSQYACAMPFSISSPYDGRAETNPNAPNPSVTSSPSANSMDALVAECATSSQLGEWLSRWDTEPLDVDPDEMAGAKGGSFGPCIDSMVQQGTSSGYGYAGAGSRQMGCANSGYSKTSPYAFESSGSSGSVITNGDAIDQTLQKLPRPCTSARPAILTF